MTKLRDRSIQGVLWSFVEQFLTKGVALTTTLVLAWFLTPNDYALVAMLAVIIALSTALVDGGLGQSLIRKINVSEVELSTVFWTNIVLSIIVYFLVYISSPIVADFYGENRLIDLIRVVALAVFFQSIVVVQKAVLSRALKFKMQVKVVLPSAVLSSLIAVVLAQYEYGVWALIIQILTNSIFIAAFYWSLNLWRPSLVFCFGSLKELWKSSKFIVMDSLVEIPFKNMYLIVLPKYFSSGPVGLYFFAEKVKEVLIGLIVQSVQTVTYPALSQIQEDDARLKQGYRKVISVTTFLMFPMMFFLAALTSVVFELALPEKWHGAVIYLQLMCLASIMYPVHSLNINILKVKGGFNLVFYIGVYKRVVNVLVFIYTLQFGIFWVIVGQIVLSVVHFVPNAYYSAKLIKYSWVEQVADFMPGLVLSGLIAGLIYYLQNNLDWVPIIELMSLSLLALVLYLAGSYLFKLQAYQLAQEFIMQKFVKKTKTI